MPYIKPEARKPLDVALEPLIKHVKALPLEEQDGALNYALTRLLLSVYPRRYFHYNRLMGVLSCTMQECYRAIIAPYEDEKRQENGPVEPMRDDG